jgi:hypothetical protein
MRIKVRMLTMLVLGLSAGGALGAVASSSADNQLVLPHFECYEIKGHNPPHVVNLENQFGIEEEIEPGRARQMCVPTKKTVVEGPAPPATDAPLDHLKCYFIRGDKPDAEVDLRNQFGEEKEVLVGKPQALCVPTSKTTPLIDRIIDLDGIATADVGGPGDQQVTPGAALTSWPTGGGSEGIDMFDNDGNAAWTFGAAGDDLHLEDPAGACETAIRDGVHNLGADCKVLDIDGSLTDGQPVNCDFEVGAFCPPGLPDNVKFHDANGDAVYNNGEDIVLDVNGNGVFD